MANSGPEQATSGTAPTGKKPKRKITKYLGIVIALVIIIIVLAFVLSGSGNPPKTTFAIVQHSVNVEPESITSSSFNVTISFVFNNTGPVAGNVTIIFKVISGSYTWAGAQIFNNVPPGQTLSSYKEHIPVLGDVNGNWVYECFINGQKAVKYPHP